MVREMRFVICLAVGIVLLGCGRENKKEQPVWKDIKIGDLAPLEDRKGEGQRLKTINFVVSIFELPADKADRLEEFWKGLFVQPVRFKSYQAFKANSFEIGFGNRRDAAGVLSRLRNLGGKRKQTVSFMFENGRSDELSVGVLPGQEKLFYQSVNGSRETITVGPGRIVLRMKAGKVLGMKGLCRLRVEAVVLPPGSRYSRFLSTPDSSEYVFDFSIFQLKMSPGDFVLLGPGEQLDPRPSLSDHFFRRSRPSKLLMEPSEEGGAYQPYSGPVVRFYMIICTGVNV